MASAWERWQQENANDQSQSGEPSGNSPAPASGGFFDSLGTDIAVSRAEAMSGNQVLTDHRYQNVSTLSVQSLPVAQSGQGREIPQPGYVSGPQSKNILSAGPATLSSQQYTSARASDATRHAPLPPSHTPAQPVAHEGTNDPPSDWAMIHASDAHGAPVPASHASSSQHRTAPSAHNPSSSKQNAAPMAVVPDASAGAEASSETIERSVSGRCLVSLQGPPSDFASLLASATTDPPVRRTSHAGSVAAPPSPSAAAQDGLGAAGVASGWGSGQSPPPGAASMPPQLPSFDASDLPLGAGTAEALAAALRKAREAMPDHSAPSRLLHTPDSATTPTRAPAQSASAPGSAEGRTADAPVKRRGIFGLFGGGRKAAATAAADAAAAAAAEEAAVDDSAAAPATMEAAAAAAAAAADPAAAAGAADTAALVARECLRLERVRAAQARRIAALEAEAAGLREEVAEASGEVDAIRQAYAEVRGEREEAGEQVEQLLDKYCEAVRDTAMLVARLERYKCAPAAARGRSSCPRSHACRLPCVCSSPLAAAALSRCMCGMCGAGQVVASVARAAVHRYHELAWLVWDDAGSSLSHCHTEHCALARRWTVACTWLSVSTPVTTHRESGLACFGSDTMRVAPRAMWCAA